MITLTLKTLANWKGSIFKAAVIADITAIENAISPSLSADGLAITLGGVQRTTWPAASGAAASFHDVIQNGATANLPAGATEFTVKNTAGTITLFTVDKATGNCSVLGTFSPAAATAVANALRADQPKSSLTGVTATVAANALTLTLKAGAVLDFRSPILTTGVPNTRFVPADISLVISSGSTLGTVSAQQSRIAILAIDNAGTIELAAVNLAGGTNLDETTLLTTTAEGGAGAADSASVAYSTTARASLPFRVVGYVESTQTTAGTWAQTPSEVQGMGGSVAQRAMYDYRYAALAGLSTQQFQVAAATLAAQALRAGQYGSQINGWTYANNGADATNDIDIAAGSGLDSTRAYWITGAALTKQLDAAWAVGTAAGGLDTGSIGNSDYYIWAIARSDTGVVDYLFSLSSTAPTMPANYDYKRLIGWIKRVGATIVAFHTYETEGGGIELAWNAPTLDINLSATLTTARRTDAVKVPLNFSTIVNLQVYIQDASATAIVNISSPDQTDAAPSASLLATNALVTGVTESYNAMTVRTSTTGTIAARATLATVDNYRVATIGFTWARRL